MKSVMFPTTVIDNFFDNPDSVREFALSLEYEKDPTYTWPGMRTKPLHEISPVFFRDTVNRFLNVYYNDEVKKDWIANMYFQKVDSSFKQGWVHTDTNMIVSNIVYLDKDVSPNSGTTIYEPVGISPIIDLYDKGDYNRNTNSTHLIEKNNRQYKESVVIKNDYNRMVSFDSHLYHAANEFVAEERLTLVFFIGDLLLQRERYPLNRMRTGLYGLV